MCIFVVSACGGGGAGENITYSPPTFSNDYSNLSVLEGSLLVSNIVATDTNNRPVSYSITDGEDKDLFSMSLSGQLEFIIAPNFESPSDGDSKNTYNITVSASAGENTSIVEVIISVEDAFEGRVGHEAISGAVVFIDSNSNFKLDGSESSTFSNSQGFFYLSKGSNNCSEICSTNFVAQGGTYINLNQRNSSMMYAPILRDELVTITPVSTLIVKASNDSVLMNSLGISESLLSVLKEDVWLKGSNKNSLRSKLKRVNYQLGYIFGTTNSLFVNDDISNNEITSKTAEKLIDIINVSSDGIRDQSTLDLFYRNLRDEIDFEYTYTNQSMSTLAKTASEINKLLMNDFDEISDSLGMGYRELISRSYSTIINPIKNYANEYISENLFSTGITLANIFSNNQVLDSLLDTDADGLANVVDLNDDNDSAEDLNDAFPLDLNETIDTDQDGVGNNADTDDDGDGVIDTDDDYPLNKNVHTAPKATLSNWSIDILPKSQNSSSGTLTGTSQNNRAISFTLTENASKGTVTITDANVGSFSYQAPSGTTGTSSDSFKYKVNDGFVDSSELTVNVSLNSDTLYEYQWYLDNTGQLGFASSPGTSSKDINVDTVIAEGFTGKNIKVAVVDSGLEIDHEDLKDNVISGSSYNFLNSSSDPTSSSTNGDHGTSVAGIIGAKGWNNLGIRGVAPGVGLKGFNLLKSGTNANAISSLGGASYSNDVDIFNLSYGYETTASFAINAGIKAQFIDGVTNLRSGKGAIYVASSGNGFRSFGSAVCDDANTFGLSCNNPSMDPEHSLPYLILVGALNASGSRASYSTAGSAVWVSAPGGEQGLDINIVGTGYSNYSPAMMTTDQSSCDKGYVRTNLSSYANAFENKGSHSLNTSCNYTSTFSGTSSAAPVISGIVALLLEANSALTWRDIKHILANSAIQVDASIQSIVVNGYIAEPAWTTNAAGYKFHNSYGFGSVDTASALTLAKNYTTGSLGAFVTSDEKSSGNLNSTIPDNSNDGVTNAITDDNNLTVETVSVNICLSHDQPSDISIALTSPQGTRSVLLPPYSGFSDTDTCFDLISNAFYGENSSGNWSIKVVDKKTNTEGTLSNWKITVFGR